MQVDQSTEDSIPALHCYYCKVTGLVVELTMQRISMWREWCAKGWTIKELSAVIFHLKHRKYSNPSFRVGAMRFYYLIGDANLFEELLAEARALSRAPRPPAAREAALRSTGRGTNTAGAPAKSAEQIMRDNEALKKFLEVRKTL
jgi:hypothetical protein